MSSLLYLSDQINTLGHLVESRYYSARGVRVFLCNLDSLRCSPARERRIVFSKTSRRFRIALVALRWVPPNGKLAACPELPSTYHDKPVETSIHKRKGGNDGAQAVVRNEAQRREEQQKEAPSEKCEEETKVILHPATQIFRVALESNK